MYTNLKNIFFATIFLVASAAACSDADVFHPDSAGRKKLSLNGNWKCTASDPAGFQKPEFDDSSWTIVNVPMKQGVSPLGKTSSLCCRYEFTPGDKEFYTLLRVDSLLDEGEIWLNGQKLTNPVYQPPLEDRQFGSYLASWRFDWPNFFPIWDIFRRGGKNVIAVRVSRDFTRAPGAVATIDGSVFLLSPPDLFIRTMERSHTENIAEDGSVTHHFMVSIGNSLAGDEDTVISFSILDSSGTKVFEEKKTRTIPSGGGVAEFSWKTRPLYKKYIARANLKTKSGSSDSAVLDFHGTIVQLSGNRLLLNGEPFIVKGIEGAPGAEYSGDSVSADPVLATTAVDDETRRIAAIGVNTIRTDYPAPPVMKASLENGIMIIPVIRDNWARNVIALRDYPNILYWDISVNTERELFEAAEAISALDPYSRPVSFTGLPNITVKAAAAGVIDLAGVDAFGQGKNICDGSSPALQAGLPVVLVNWGLPVTDVAWEHAPVKALQGLSDVWKTCVYSGRTSGAVYASIVDFQDPLPTLRGPMPGEWNPYMAEILSLLFTDIIISRDLSEDKKHGAEITAVSDSILHDVRAYSGRDSSRSLITKSDVLNSKIALRLPLPSAESSILILYETNGDISRKVVMNPAEPVLDPGVKLLWPPVSTLLTGRQEKAFLVIKGGVDTQKVSISATVDNPAVTISPATRSAFLPAGSDIDVPYTISAAGDATSALITVVVKFESGNEFPLKSYLPVTFE